MFHYKALLRKFSHLPLQCLSYMYHVAIMFFYYDGSTMTWVNFNNDCLVVNLMVYGNMDSMTCTLLGHVTIQ